MSVVRGQIYAVLAEDELGGSRRIVQISADNRLNTVIERSLEGDGDMRAFFGHGGPYMGSGVGLLTVARQGGSLEPVLERRATDPARGEQRSTGPGLYTG